MEFFIFNTSVKFVHIFKAVVHKDLSSISFQLSTAFSVGISKSRQIYKQFNGVAVGLLIGATLINIFVCSREALFLGKM